ncbi:MAG: dTDP-4-dehydrorhamnose 3,5-epimerase [Actinomycetia bacterium]|nr:dTDP-4-dehydrorhamnose 3,5-epimerase [Actinomycetes bacterium]
MDITPLSIEGAWAITPKQHGDDRGVFLEVFKQTRFHESVGHDLSLAQANCSVSAAGTVRGIHFADLPPGQAKYITCLSGAVLDVIVDIRVGSPTFGEWTSVVLDTKHRRSVYLSEGLGHGFAALESGATVMYLCSAQYSPTGEHEINPLDPALGIDWQVPAADVALSSKDAAAPSLAEAAAQGLLPDYGKVQGFRSQL